MTNTILQRLLATDDLAEKAAIVAESVFEQLPEVTALIGRRCVLLHWFDQALIEALLNDSAVAQKRSIEIYEQIISLPFIEVLGWGAALNNFTRAGLLKYYAQSRPELLIMAAKLAAPAYLSREAYGTNAAEAFFCYYTSGEADTTMKLLDDLLEKAVHREDWLYIKSLVSLQEEAEQLGFVQFLPHTEKQWILQGLAHGAMGEHEAAIVAYNNAITMNSQSALTYILRGSIYVQQKYYEEALREYGHALLLKPTSTQAHQVYINQGVIYFRLRRYKEGITNFTQALQVELPEGTISSLVDQRIVTELLNHQTLIPDQAMEMLHTLRKSNSDQAQPSQGPTMQVELKHVLDLVERHLADIATRVRPEQMKESGREKQSRDTDKLVMIIDDSLTVRKIIETSLKREGFDCVSYPDGIEALQALTDPRQRIPDLIILDISLPKMDGYEIARRLRSNQQFSNIVIVMLSARDGVIDRLKGRLAGAKDYLTKPFKTQDVISIVNSYIGVEQKQMK
jgi:twitching motility two-component system response regulator PilG